MSPRPPRTTSRALRTLAALLLLASCTDEPTGVVDSSLTAPEAALIAPTGPNSVRLVWANVDAGATSYRIERRANLQGDFFEIAEIPAAEDSTTSFLDIGLEAETFYGYRVRTIGRLGSVSAPSVVFGVLTPPLPAIEVSTLTNAPNAESADLDGYLIRITGPVNATIQVGSADTKRSIPLTPGSYTARIEGVRESCEVVGPSEVAIEVTDVGIETISAITFSVVCRDPTRGEVVVEVEARGDVPSGTQYGVGLTGVIADSSDVDITRDVNAAAFVSTRFQNLLPGTYQAALRDFDTETCRVEGDAVSEEFEVGALTVDTIRFALDCSEVIVQNPDAPYRWTNEWEEDEVEPDGTAVLRVRVDATSRPSTALSAISGLLQWDQQVATLDSAAGVGDFSSIFVANVGVGQVDFNAVSPAGTSGDVDFGRFYFTVTGELGEILRTRTSRDGDRLIIADANETQISLDSIFVVEDTLTVGEGGGPTPLVAEASGPYSGVVDQPVTFDGSQSSGEIEAWVWDFGDGAPVDSAGATVQHAYAAAGSYLARLTVRDTAGVEMQDSATVTIIEPSTGSGNVVGRWVNESGAPITSASAGDDVRFQLCTTVAGATTFQASFGGFSGLATNTASRDLNSAGSGVHPDCVGAVDNLDAFFTASGTTEPINAQIVTTAATSGTGNQGIFEFDFTLDADGDLDVTLADIVATDENQEPIAVVLDIATLTVGGGGEPTSGVPSGTAWHHEWSADSLGIGDPVTLSVSTNPGEPLYWVVGDVAWNGAVLDFDSATVDPFFVDLADVNLESSDRVGIVARGPSGSPVPADTAIAVAQLHFTVANTGTSVATASEVTLWSPGLQRIETVGLDFVTDTLKVGSGSPNDRPMASIGAPAVGVTGSAVNFSGAGSSDPDGVIVSYAWTFGDGATGTGPNPSHTYTEDGTYPVLLTVTDDDGGIASDSISVTTVTTAVPVANANGPYAGQAGQTIGFTASGSFDPDGSIVLFSWDLGDGSTATGPAPSYAYSSAGTFQVVLTVRDDAGVSVSDTTTATIAQPTTFSMGAQWSSAGAPPPLPGGPSAAPVQGPPGQAGPGDRMRLTVSTRSGLAVTGAGTRIGFDDAVVRLDSIVGHPSWNTSFDTSAPTADSTLVSGVRSTPTGPADESVLADLYFTVIGIEGDSTGITLDQVFVLDAAGDTTNVTALPTVESVLNVAEVGAPPPVSRVGGPYSADVGQEVTFDGGASTPGSTETTIVRYDWSFGDGGLAGDGGPTPAHTYTSAGTYVVSLTVTDSEGATASSSTTATIDFPAPTGNIVARWVDAAGAPITSASVGDRVQLQICTPLENVSAIQLFVEDFAAVATAVDSDDLDSTASGVHPTCSGTTDILDSFFTATGTDDPFNMQIVDLGGTPGVGAQGAFYVDFDLVAAGTLVDIVSFIEWTTLDGNPPTPVLDVGSLTVN